MRSSRRRLLRTGAVAFASSAAGCAGVVDSLTRGASVAWRVDAPVRAFEVSGGRTYVRTPDEVRAFDRADGSALWRTPVPTRDDPETVREWRASRWSSWGLVVGPRFVFTRGPGGVAAIDPADGRRVWTDSGRFQSLFRGDGALTAYESDGDETVGFDPATGERLWSWTDAMIQERTPRHGLSFGDELTVVDLRTGESRWSLDAGEDQHAVDVEDETLFVAVETGAGTDLRALGLADGGERWRRDLPADADDGAVVDGALYVSSGDGGPVAVHALDLGTGAERWRTEVPDWRTDAVPLLTTGEQVVFGQSWWEGPLPNACSLDRATGALRWERADHDVVAAAEGTTALSTGRGRFVGVDADGEERWGDRLDFVPMAKVNGVARYDPPAALPGAERFVAGFRGTNALYEYGVRSGRRTWELHLEEAFATVRRAGPADGALYAAGEGWVSRVEIE